MGIRVTLVHGAFLFLLAILALSPTARAQITWTAEPSILPNFPFPDPSSNYLFNPSISSATATATANGFKLTGDMTLFYDRSLPLSPDGAHAVFQLVVDRPFTVGPLPANVQGRLTENLEAVIGNGSLTAPEVELRTYELFFVDDGQYPIITALGFGGIGYSPPDNYGTVSLTGNSFRAFDTNQSGPAFILGPGFHYHMQYRIEAWVNNAGLASNDPPPTITFEFGGVSAFSGIEASALGVLLPEPSSFVMLGCGAFLIVLPPLWRRVVQQTIEQWAFRSGPGLPHGRPIDSVPTVASGARAERVDPTGEFDFSLPWRLAQ